MFTSLTDIERDLFSFLLKTHEAMQHSTLLAKLGANSVMAEVSSFADQMKPHSNHT